MAIRPSLLRTIAAASLATATLIGITAGPAAALDPPRPLPGYHPAFVTETDTRPWQDCLWASGAMLLDKWTNGRDTISRQALRRLSGDSHGGSTLADLRTAYAKLGIDLAYSPDGGARITWPTLLSRLEHGAGAVLLGDDSKLPRWYGRWDPPFWQATGEGDNHAVYIERYDRKRGRVWLMDPLGRGDWAGEWISVGALKRYAWRTRAGVLSVAVTPTAKAAPFAGVVIGAPSTTLTAITLDVDWGIKAPAGWRLPGTTVAAKFETAEDPLKLAAESNALRLDAAPPPAPPQTVANASDPTLHAKVMLPSDPGAYLATTTVKDLRFGKVVARSDGVLAFVPGPRRATIELDVSETTVVAGSPVGVTLWVMNTGEELWASDAAAPALRSQVVKPRNTRVVARWIPLAAAPGPTATGALEPGVAAPPAATSVGAVPLAPGQMSQLVRDIQGPDAPGVWALVFDIVDDIDGSFATLGSAPATQTFVVLSAPQVRVERLVAE